MEQELKEILKDLEIQIISFMIREEKYVKYLFTKKTRNQILRDFNNNNTKYVAELILTYYEKHNSVLIESEFMSIIDNSVNNKEITNGESFNYQDIYRTAMSYKKTLDNEQFNRIYSEWENTEARPKCENGLKDCLELLNTNQTMKFIDAVREMFRGVYKDKSNDDYINTLDFENDKEKQIKDIIDRRDNEEKYASIKTGYGEELDRKFIGFEKGTLSLIGGLSSSGKSTLAMNFAYNIAKSGKKVLIISLEMPELQYARKLNSRESHVEYDKLLKPAMLNDDELEKIKKVINERNINLKVLDIAANCFTWGEITSIIEERMPEYEPDIIFIDYLSLISLGGNTKERRDVLLGNLGKEIRSYARQKKIPIVAVVQANRSSKVKDKRTGKSKISIELENIEDSNKLGQDCDNFIAVIPEKTEGSHITKMGIYIAKQREGERDITITLQGELRYSWIYDNKSLSDEMWVDDIKDPLFEKGEEKSIFDDINDFDEEIKNAGLKDCDEGEDNIDEENTKNDLDDLLGISRNEVKEKKDEKKENINGFNIYNSNLDLDLDLGL